MMNEMLSVLIFLCSVFAPFAETGAARLTCLSLTIKAEPGGSVTLQCFLDPPVNLSPYTVDVSRLDLDANDNVVHVYRRGQDHLRPQMAQYKGRTTLNRKDLIRGVLTLIISLVKLSDGGRYEVFVRELNANCVIDLTVAPKDQQNSTSRDDSSPTKLPVEGATKPYDGDAAKAEPLWKTVLPSVGGCVAAAAAVVGIVLLILVKLGIIQNFMGTNRGRREQEAQVTNGTELSPLRASTQDDLNHDGPGNNVQVV